MLLSRNLYPSYNQESWSQSRAHIGSTPETLFQKELLQPKICICLPQRLRHNPSSSSAPNGHWAPRLLDWFSCWGTLGSPFRGAASPHSTNQSVLREINANTLLKDELWTLFQSSELTNNWGCIAIPVVGGKLSCRIQRWGHWKVCCSLARRCILWRPHPTNLPGSHHLRTKSHWLDNPPGEKCSRHSLGLWASPWLPFQLDTVLSGSMPDEQNASIWLAERIVTYEHLSIVTLQPRSIWHIDILKTNLEVKVIDSCKAAQAVITNSEEGIPCLSCNIHGY